MTPSLVKWFHRIDFFNDFSFTQAMIDICAEQGWLATVLRIQQLLQCIVQARWLDDPVVLTLPNVEEQNVPCFKALNIRYAYPFNYSEEIYF